MDSQIAFGLIMALSLSGIIAAMVLLVLWARRGGRGAVISGALLTMFAPDPELEKNIRLAEEARQEQHEEDEEGQGRD